MALRFTRLTEADLPMLTQWLKRPHVAEWWESFETIADVRAHLPGVADSSTEPYIAFLDDLPIGYIQSYVATASGNGWWPDERDPGVRGIDQFLADERHLGHGLGTQMVREFVQFLFKDSSVTRIQTDPAPHNHRAIRCYLKAGFGTAGPITTPDGAAVLMVMERDPVR